MANICQISKWHLPESVVQKYQQNGLEEMFQWQSKCLMLDGVLSGRNLVFAAPTSAGKTFVAEILMLKRVLETKRKALFILPFVSVAREKLFHLQNLFDETGIRVDGYMGGYAPSSGVGSWDIAVCTIEKANSVINRLIADNKINTVGMLVIDELHMVGDKGRGYILELLLTKVQYLCAQKNDLDVQIVGMSATLPNLQTMATWLKAILFKTDFRPVPLERCLKINDIIFDESLNEIRKFKPYYNFKADEESIIALCYETVFNSHSVLVFCPTKSWCENLCLKIAEQFYYLNKAHHRKLTQHCVNLNIDAIKDVMVQLNRSPSLVDPTLCKTIPCGVAFHHAGLTIEERDIIERGFRNGAIIVLVATSTLSSGVNLPARRVIIRSPMFNRSLLDVRTYRQMTGRAGRKGVDTKGESILICKNQEVKKAKCLLTAQELPVKSCLIESAELSMCMKRAILEVVVNGIANTLEDVMGYTNCTLLYAELQEQDNTDQAVSQSVIEECIHYLVDREFLHLNQDCESKKQKISSTQLGRAALLSSLPITDALTVLTDLHSALKALSLETDLHLTYLVTPIFCYNDWVGLDWYTYLNIYEALPSRMKNVAKLIGIEEQFLMQMASTNGHIPNIKNVKKAERFQQLLRIHRRFYAALSLYDLILEVPLHQVSIRFVCNKGMLQQLQQSASAFAGMVTVFCQELGWWSLEILLKEFQTRLAFGVQRELVDLMQIYLLNGQRARALYNAEYTTCEILADAKVSDIECILRNAFEFQSSNQAFNENEWEVKERKKLRTIHVTGQNGLTEEIAAKLIIQEAAKISNKIKHNTESQLSQFSPGVSSADATNSDVNVQTQPDDLHPSKVSNQHQNKNDKTCSRFVDKVNYSARTNIGSTLMQSNTNKCKSSENQNVLNGSDDNSIEIKATNISEINNSNENISDVSLGFDTHSPSVSNCQPDISNEVVNKLNISLNSGTFWSNGCSHEDSKIHLSLLSSSESEKELDEYMSNISEGFKNISLDNHCGNVVEEVAITLSQANNIKWDDFDESVKDDEKPTEIDFTQNREYISADIIAEMDDSFNVSVLPDFAKESTPSNKRVLQPNISQNQIIRHSTTPNNKLNISDTLSPMMHQQTSTKILSSLENSKSFTSQRSDSSSFNLFSETVKSDNSRVIDISVNEEKDECEKFSLISENGSAMSQFTNSLQEKLNVIDVCCDQELFNTFLKEWKQRKYFSLSVIKDNITCDLHISVCWNSLDVYYIQMSILDDDTEENKSPPYEQKLNLVHFLLSLDKSMFTVVGNNIKNIFKVLHDSLQVFLTGKWLDPSVAAWMLEPTLNSSKSLKELLTDYMPNQRNLLNALKQFCKPTCTECKFNCCAPASVTSCTEAVVSYKLIKVLKEELKLVNIWKCFTDIEMVHVQKVAELEYNGMKIDMPKLKIFKNKLYVAMKSLEKRAHGYSCQPFRLSSPQDIAKVLFDELGLPPGGKLNNEHNKCDSKTRNLRSWKSNKRGSKSWSTNKTILTRLSKMHQLPSIINDWRMLNYTLNTYIVSILDKCLKIGNETIIQSHCITKTLTGRVSMAEPNIQNIPNDFKVNLFDNVQIFSARSLFIASHGCSLLSVDYNQLELRIFAHLSNDTALIKILNDVSLDSFCSIAAKWKEKEVAMVTEDERHATKQLCYGMLYGIGPSSLAEQLNSSETEAEEFMKTFMDCYPGIKSYIQKIIKKCKENGFITTLLKRRRYFYNISNSNLSKRSAAERQAINTTVQGSAADLVKLATINLMNSLDQYTTKYKFILQLHDEIIIEVRNEVLNEVIKSVKYSFENAMNLKVKLPVKIKTGPNWGILKLVESL